MKSIKELMNEQYDKHKKNYKSIITDEIGKHYKSVSYTSPMPLVDFLNGSIKENIVLNKTTGCEDRYIYECLGIGSGTVIQFAGTSQTGKSTYARTVAAHIARQFKRSIIIDQNSEGGMDDQWFRTLSGWSAQEIREKYVLKDTCTVPSVRDDFTLLVDTKKAGIKEHPDEFLYDTGLLDYDGNPIIHPIPSFFILDSWKSIMMPKYEDRQGEDMRNNMDSATEAKLKGALLNDMVQYCRKYNIIIFIINSFHDKIDVGFSRSKKQFMYSPGTGYLPGGKWVEHFSDEIYLLSNEGAYKPDDGLRLHGHNVGLLVLKTRANKNAGVKVNLSFLAGIGFSHEITMYNYLMEVGLIEGTIKKSFYGYPEVKFFQKNFVDDFESKPELRKIFKKVAIPALSMVMGVSGIDNVKRVIDRNKLKTL